MQHLNPTNAYRHTISMLVLKTSSTSYCFLDFKPSGERRKLMHMFDNVNAILFLVDISDYDQFLFEDTSAVCICLLQSKYFPIPKIS